MPALHPHDAAAFAALSQTLLAEPVVDISLQVVVDLAVETIEGCEYAGVSLRRGRTVETPAATDPLVDQLDRWQYELSEGPCLHAVFVDEMYVITDLYADDRWPTWAPKAASLGVRSVLSVRLATPRAVVGALNLYSTAPYAYGDDQVLTAGIYAAHASNAIAATNKVEQLGTGMQTRHMIGLAQGLLMCRYGLTEELAFQFLSRTSMTRNVKLRDVAASVIADAKDHAGRPT
jgi:GAF domain-containing protein